jgi:FdhD protein
MRGSKSSAAAETLASSQEGRPDEAASKQVLHWSAGEGWVEKRDALAREEPLEIRVQGRSIAVTMRTPGYDSELAAGFLLSEGLIRNRNDVVEIAHCQQGEAARHQNILSVFLAPAVTLDFERLTRHVYASSSCGLCGKASIEQVHQNFPAVDHSSRVQPEVLLGLPEHLRSAQYTFHETGGLHAAAIFDLAGNLLVAREDVGRHNAVDKVIGHGFLESQLPFSNHILLVSGRASFEIMQKALAARIPVVAAISAPSSLAVEFAGESGQTLVGFLRGGSMNVYAGAERITQALV